MSTKTDGVYARLTAQGLSSRPTCAAEIARDLAARLDKATAELAQKDAAIKALGQRLVTTANLDNDGPCWCTRFRPSEHQARCLLFRDALRLAGALK
jgi:hypothetical protein